jgi:hypothetical protein
MRIQPNSDVGGVAYLIAQLINELTAGGTAGCVELKRLCELMN